jgi:dipeptidyl aminopeptidase/acylaminoacyl peptidase
VLHWLDGQARDLQAKIDRALPNTINILKTKNTSNRFMLVFSLSETEPGTNYLYDQEKKQLELLNHTRPWLPTTMLAERERITFTARDGLQLQAWVTKPKTAKPEKLPLIVHINAFPIGSFVYGADGYDLPYAQYLASRGYVVIETLTRGAFGYGKTFTDAGRHEIGRKMQDDIVDAAQYLAKTGLVDSTRMCLLGMQYGGYAALNALVRDPDLWRCASAYGAPTELKANSTIWWVKTIISEFDSAQQGKNSSARNNLLTQLSPIANIGAYKGQVKLFHDADDKTVPAQQSQDFFRAMKEAGKEIDLKIYDKDDSPLSRHQRLVDFMKESEIFFAKTLKPLANVTTP